MSLLGIFKKRRARLNDWLTEKGMAHTFSLAAWLLHWKTMECMQKYARESCLDAGSGRSPYRDWMLKHGIHVTSIDIEDRAGRVDVIADIQKMPEISDQSVRTILCTQVLEHVPRPENAISEMARVLKPDGTLILSVPHLSLIHEAPHDYFRYTRYGLKAMLERNGFEPLEIQEVGGFLSFIAHAVSMFSLCTIGSLPGLRLLTWGFNYIFLIRLLAPLDRIFGLGNVYPCNYVVLARRADPTR